MATPLNPGWYPAPDGRGEQWWNGAGWSEARRGVAAPGSPPPVSPLPPGPPPVAAPRPLAAPDPYAPQAPLPIAQPAAQPLASRRPQLALIGLILSAVGLFAFQPLGVAGIVLGVLSMRRSDPGQPRWMGIAAITLGGLALLAGAAQLVAILIAIGSAGDGFR